MAVTAQTPFSPFTAAPGATVFSSEFRVLQASDLVVKVNGAVITSGFSVSGIGAAGGVDVTFSTPMTGGEVVELLRDIPLTRATDYQQLGDFLAPVVNQDFDRLWMSQQDQEFKIGGALRLPSPEQGAEIPAAAGRARKLFYFDENGAPVMLGGTPGTVLGFDTEGDAVSVAPATGSATALALSLAGTGGAGLVGFQQAGAGAVARTAQSKMREVVSVRDFGATGDGVTDDTAAIQAAINYAESLVTAAIDNVGDPVNGADVVFSGVYKITEPIRVSKSNVCLMGQGGATIYPYFTSKAGYNGAKPAFIIGSAELWQTTGLISNSYKYNTVKGIHIKRVQGYDGFIGFLVSGTRNATIKESFVERGFAGVYLENSSEFYSDQLSVIGCTYGIVLDNRGDRPANHSVLNVACTDNDVSSNKIDMTTIYYSQHTGVLAINTGTTSLDSMTMGNFSDNPEAGSPGLGLPAEYAGIHVWGANSKWTRSMLLENIVFEAQPGEVHDCIRIESTTANNPIQGVTMNNMHVQTYSADPQNNILTTLLRVVRSGAGDVHDVVLRDSGFAYQSAGFFTGRLIDVGVDGTAGVRLENCYPASAFVHSNLGYFGTFEPFELLERVKVDAFPPTGWTAGGVTTGCTKVGGSSGVYPYLEFKGDAGDMYIEKTFDYLDYQFETKAIFVTFLAQGDADLYCVARVNGVDSTSSNIIDVDGINTERYGQAIVPNTVSPSGFKRLVFCFKPFGANFDLQLVRFRLGRKANATPSKFVRIKDIKVGYFVGSPVPYNPFS